MLLLLASVHTHTRYKPVVAIYFKRSDTLGLASRRFIHISFPNGSRHYGVGAQIIRDMGISKLKLITNNPKKRVGLIGYGLEIVENISIEVDPNVHNKKNI